MPSRSGTPPAIYVLRTVLVLVALTSLCYTASASWSLYSTVTGHHHNDRYTQRSNNDDDDEADLTTTLSPTPHKASSYYPIDVTCLSVSLSFSFVEAIACVWLLVLVSCAGGELDELLSSRGVKWVLATVITTIVLVVAYLVPFSFDHHQEEGSSNHATIEQFGEKLGAHFREVVEITKGGGGGAISEVENLHDFVGGCVLAIHLLVVVVGVCIVVGGVMMRSGRGCCGGGGTGKSGYTAVR